MDEFKDKTVLISGANGFIPSYLVEIFLALPTKKVFGLVRNHKKANLKFKHHLTNPRLCLLTQDVCEPINLNENIDIIIHAASQASPKFYGSDPVGTLRANSLGTLNMLEYAKNYSCQRFIFISSGEVYGDVSQLETVSEEYTGNVPITNVRSCYAESKRMGETMCVAYAKQFGLHVNMLRLGHTYGAGIPLDAGRVFADFIRDALQGRDIQLHSDGSALRNFLYITDLILGLFTILIKADSGEAYNIASEYETSILDLAYLIVDISENKSLNVSVQKNCSKSYIPSSAGRINLNTDKLKALGWEEKISIKEGFTRMLRSYL